MFSCLPKDGLKVISATPTGNQAKLCQVQYSSRKGANPSPLTRPTPSHPRLVVAKKVQVGGHDPLSDPRRVVRHQLGLANRTPTNCMAPAMALNLGQVLKYRNMQRGNGATLDGLHAQENSRIDHTGLKGKPVLFARALSTCRQPRCRASSFVLPISCCSGGRICSSQSTSVASSPASR